MRWASPSCLSFYFRKVVSSCSSCTEPYALSHQTRRYHTSLAKKCSRARDNNIQHEVLEIHSRNHLVHSGMDPLLGQSSLQSGPLGIVSIGGEEFVCWMILFYHTKSARPLKCRKELWRNKSRCRPANRRYRTGTRRHQEVISQTDRGLFGSSCPSQRTRVSGRNGRPFYLVKGDSASSPCQNILFSERNSANYSPPPSFSRFFFTSLNSNSLCPLGPQSEK
jgi:hypothetical protein